MQEFFSIGFYDTLIRFAVCILVNWSIVHFLYFRKSHRRDFYFTFVIISIAIFFLVYLMMGMDRGKATMGVSRIFRSPYLCYRISPYPSHAMLKGEWMSHLPDAQFRRTY